MVATEGDTVRVYSCYASLDLSIDEFEQFLSRLDGSVEKYRGAGVDLIVAGNFNARSTSWENHLTTYRGDVLSTRFLVANVERESMFFGRGMES